MESYAIPRSSTNLKGSGTVVKTLRDKVPNPKKSEQKNFSIPPENKFKLYLRTLEGNRVWATVPQDKKALSNEERSAIENYLGLRINDIPEVSDKDVICWGLYVEKFFPGDYTKTNEAFKIKLPDPSSGVEKQFTLVLDGKTNEKLVFSKKVTVGGALVWTVPKTHQKTVAKLFDLSMKNSQLPHLKTLFIFWEKKHRDFGLKLERQKQDVKSLIP